MATNGRIEFGNGEGWYDGTYLSPFLTDQDARPVPEGVANHGIWVDLNTTRDSVVITWNNVALYGQGTTILNTYQVEILDRGDSDSEIILRYSDMQGSRYRSDGVSLDFSSYTPITRNIDAADLDTEVGNTGVAGVWQYRLEDGWFIGGDIHGSFHHQMGTEAGDTLTGQAGFNAIQGLAGDDTITDHVGNDTLTGDAGDDYIHGR